MTICIAAIADQHEAIISCVDTKISTLITSLEPPVGQKMRSIRGWTILSAGTTCYAESFLDTLRGLLAESSDNEPETIKRLLEKALLIELPKFTATKYLTPYGIDMPTFLQFRQKKAGFSDERWNELSRLIFEYSDQYDVEVLVSGWGGIQENHVREENSQAIAHIFSVSRNGIVPHSHDGFYCCGSGTWAAHSVLSFFNYESRATIAHAIYCVAAAKFMAERTEGVGRTTTMRVTERVGEGEWKGYFIQPVELDEIRTIWEKTGAPRMTDAAEDAIIEIVAKHQKSQRTSAEHIVRKLNKFVKGEEIASEPKPSAPQKSEPEK